MLNDAVNKMHDCKVQHEKVSEYNLALSCAIKINALFTVQRSFEDAENLARALYTEELVNSVVDVLIEGGDLAYIPGQLLVHLTTNPVCVEHLLEDDIIAVVCGVLRVGESLFVLLVLQSSETWPTFAGQVFILLVKCVAAQKSLETAFTTVR